MKKEHTEQEVREALNKLTEDGALKLVIIEGEPCYVENTYNAGYQQAVKDLKGT